MLEELWGKRIDYAVIAYYFGYTETNATVKGIYEAVKDLANQFGADIDEWDDVGYVEMPSNNRELFDLNIDYLQTGQPRDYWHIKKHLGMSNTNNTVKRMYEMMTQRRFVEFDRTRTPL